MTEAEVDEAIKLQWKTGWEALHPTIRYCFENEAFDPVTDSAWARVTIINTVRTQGTQGSHPRMDDKGYVMVSLFGAVDVGEKTLKTYADEIRAFLELKRIGNPAEIVIRAGSSRPSPTDGKWYMRTVTFPLAAYEQK